MPSRLTGLLGFCLLTLACVLTASCATSRAATPTDNDLRQSAPFAEVARTIATLNAARIENMSAWEDTPAVEVVGQLLADTTIKARFHDKVDQHKLVSGTRRGTLVATLDDIARQIGAKWHPAAGAVCFDSMEGDSVDVAVTVRYRIRVGPPILAGDLDDTGSALLVRFLMREMPGALITELRQTGPEFDVTVKAFVVTHLLFLQVLDGCVREAVLLEE